jgi:hypothetical protein
VSVPNPVDTKRRLFDADKTPFLLAILFAALAWCVNHVADRAKELPIVEYSDVSISSLPQTADHYQLCAASKNLRAYAFAVRNISAQRAFENLNLFFWSDGNMPITEARWINMPPGIAEQMGEVCNPQAKGRAMSLTLKQLQWDWNGIALVWTQDPKRPVLMYREVEQDPATSADLSSTKEPSVLLRKADLTTWIIRNEFQIYYWAIGILGVITLGYVVMYAFIK